MKQWHQAIRDSAAPAILAAAATTFTAATLGRRDSGSALAPVNATSHVLWGPQSGTVTRATLQHTVPGVLINAAAAGFWALVMERLFGARLDARPRSYAIPLAAAATAGLAYLTDYHVIPRRLTPGWELRLSRRSLGLTFGALAVGLAAGAALTRR